jgi:hypothetical protein
MNPMDMLRQARASAYGAGPKEEKEDMGSERAFPVSEEDNIPDGPCCVKVYGEAQDGKFVIDHIEPEEEK